MIRATLVELLRIGRALPSVEIGRRTKGFSEALDAARIRGRGGRTRSHSERAHLERLIRIVDRLLPGQANCYRRALLEVSIDPEAARKPFRFGLRHGGGSRSGHAWLDGDSDPVDQYDAKFAT